MSTEVPDYYRSLIENSEDPPDSSRAAADARRQSTASKQTETRSRIYRADAFQLSLPSHDWCDQSTYTLRGPRLDGVSHNITVTVVEAAGASDVQALGEQQVDRLLVEFDDSRLLVDDQIRLHSGLPAYRAILSWTPPFGDRLYQEQIYVLHEGRAFTLTATFTRASRKEMGKEIEKLMLGFQPVETGRYGRNEPL